MVLLFFIYLAFISLGLPDAVLGSVWPIMHQDLGLAISSAGVIGAIVSTGTVLSALLSSRLITRFGTWRVTVVSVFATAVGLWGYSISANLLQLILWALPLGLGAGSVDAVLNNYV
ncbi:MAG: MFS transporter, partial [Sphaerochaeta sp.]